MPIVDFKSVPPAFYENGTKYIILSNLKANEWGSRLPFGELLAEYYSTNAGWVHDVNFSPDGTMLGWVAHNSSVGYACAGDQQPKG